MKQLKEEDFLLHNQQQQQQQQTSSIWYRVVATVGKATRAFTAVLFVKIENVQNSNSCAEWVLKNGENSQRLTNGTVTNNRAEFL
jgi:hypothetical protein